MMPLFADAYSEDVNCSSKLAVIDIVCKKSITDHASAIDRTRTHTISPPGQVRARIRLTTSLWLFLLLLGPTPCAEEDTSRSHSARRHWGGVQQPGDDSRQGIQLRLLFLLKQPILMPKHTHRWCRRRPHGTDDRQCGRGHPSARFNRM